MINIATIKKRSVKSHQITVTTSKPVPKNEIINPYDPFYGTNGRKYEISYKSGLYKVTNCYAFAMGWQVAADDKYLDYIPGFLAGRHFETELVDELIKADLEAVDRKVYEVLYDIPEVLPDGNGYWIKGVMCYDRETPDFHIMRKDPKSGRWIHKVGWEAKPKLVVRNCEFKDKIDAALEIAGLTEIPREVALRLVSQILPPEQYTGITLVKNMIETDDSAGYMSFADADCKRYFEPLWVMRISEP